MTVEEPQGPWELEVQMPEERMGYINDARTDFNDHLKVTYITATNPGTTHEGTVKEIHRTAEVRGEEGNTVLIARGDRQERCARPALRRHGDRQGLLRPRVDRLRLVPRPDFVRANEDSVPHLLMIDSLAAGHNRRDWRDKITTKGHSMVTRPAFMGPLAVGVVLALAPLAFAATTEEPVIAECELSSIEDQMVPASDSGVLVKLGVSEGMHVTQGQEVARVDDREAAGHEGGQGEGL